MSVHFRKSCTVVDDVICMVPCQTKWKPTQPHLVMQGYAENVVIQGGKAYII